jgi:hypothetical protein
LQPPVLQPPLLLHPFGLPVPQELQPMLCIFKVGVRIVLKKNYGTGAGMAIKHRCVTHCNALFAIEHLRSYVEKA